MLNLIVIVDFFLLKKMLAVLTFGTEWLSLKRRWMERGLIAGHALALILLVVSDWMSGYRFVSVCLFALLPINVGAMWLAHRSPDAVRVVRLVDGAAARVFKTLFFASLSLPSLLLLHRWCDAFFVLLVTTSAAFDYAVSLPENGDRGKRRKAALAKVKEMFGTSWIVSPVPQP